MDVATLESVENVITCFPFYIFLHSSIKCHLATVPKPHLIFSLKSIKPRNDKGTGGCKQLNSSCLDCQAALLTKETHSTPVPSLSEWHLTEIHLASLCLLISLTDNVKK